MSYRLRQAVQLAAARALELSVRLQAAHAEAVELSQGLAGALDADRRDTAQDLASMAGVGIVHVLHQGFAVCAFSRDLPNDWPAGYKCVRLELDEPAGQRDATCSECIRRAPAIVRALLAAKAATPPAETPRPRKRLTVGELERRGPGDRRK